MSDAREWLGQEPLSARKMRDALLAVLELHRPCDDVLEDAEHVWCVQCVKGWENEDFALIQWPCATVRAINEALGITDE